jgi:trans-aconitate 2-methyltransferase
LRDPDQYARFADQRSRPFFTLLERIPEDLGPRRIVDLGCGSGELTQVIAQRWPAAKVLGLDNSPQMLTRALESEVSSNLNFIPGDIKDYSQPADMIFSNAALQWVDGHAELFPRLAGLINPGGIFAVQMPYSHVQRSHELIEETVRTGPWAAKLTDWHRFRVQPLEWYVELMLGLGFEVDAWETTYHFVLKGENPIFEWVKGTSLQPILTVLDDVESAEFISAYSTKLRDAYRQTPSGTIYPFNRIFFVARR